MHSMLKEQLRPVLFRDRFRRIAIELGVVWVIAALIAGVCYYKNLSTGLDASKVIWLLIGGTIVASLAAVFHAILCSKTADQVAIEIEREFSDLDSSLITSMQLEHEGEQLGFLEQDVLRTSVTHSYNNRWASIIPCLLYTSPSPRDQRGSRMPSSA